jgi:CDGSH-type Zn-finger protein
MSDIPTIVVKPNGSLQIEAPVRLVRPDGSVIPVPPRKDGTPAEVVKLCRCGGSAIKPFCDGTHKRNGFLDPPAPAPTAPVPTS